MEKIKHLIFLDFDGVLTSVENGTSFLCGKTENYHIDPKIKKYFELLFKKYPEMKVVLSTAWCNRGSLDDPTPNWPWKGLDMPTPLPSLHRWLVDKGVFYGNVSTQRKYDTGDHITKFTKIKWWLDEHIDELADDAVIVVLDDDASDYNDLRAINKLDLGEKTIIFLQMNYQNGFTPSDMKDVCDLFDLTKGSQN